MRKMRTLERDNFRSICFHDMTCSSLKGSGFGCRLLKRHQAPARVRPFPYLIDSMSIVLSTICGTINA